MSFQDSSVLVPIRIKNPFSGAVFPAAGEAEAVVDTGYSGFLLVPASVFEDLQIPKSKAGTGIVGDGRRVRLDGGFATLELTAQGTTLDGFVQTMKGTNEILLGMEGLRESYFGFDGCARRAILERCR